MEANQLKNTRTLVGPGVFNAKGTDDILNVDTTLGPVSIAIPNIRNSGYTLQPHTFYVNDISGTANVNNITILSSGGDEINGGISVIINQVRGSGQININSINEWLMTGDFGNSAPPFVFNKDNSIFGTGTVLNPYGVEGIYLQTIYVSQYGNNATAQKGRMSLAYSTIAQAVSVAVAGDLIYVLPGTYSIGSNLAKNGVDFYFSPKAVINITTTPFTDLGLGAISFNVFGSLNVTGLVAFSRSVIQLLNNGSKCFFEFNEINVETGGTFYTDPGTKQTIRGNKITETGQYVTRLNGSGVFDFNVSEIININITGASAHRHNGATGTGTTKIYFNTLINNGAGNFGAIYVVNSVVGAKCEVRGDINHQPTGAVFLDSALSINGGQIDFEGTIISTRKIIQVYGNSGIPTASIIKINNSKLVSSLNGFAVVCNNSGGWIKITNSILQGVFAQGVVVIGQNVGFGGDDRGNFHIANSTISNLLGIGIKKIGNIGNTCNIDDLILFCIGTSITTAGGPAQNISILPGGCISNVNLEVGLITNLVSGTNFTLDPTLVISPYE